VTGATPAIPANLRTPLATAVTRANAAGEHVA
jgi:hypothetical protein